MKEEPVPEAVWDAVVLLFLMRLLVRWTTAGVGTDVVGS